MTKSETIIKELESLYPDAHCELNHRNDFELLIAVSLSAQTTDERVNSVTPELFARYPDPYALAKAKHTDVEQIIRPIGLYRNKARNIVAIANQLVELHEGQVPNDRESLESLRGVGRKTANIILNNCFDEPAFAVDTHVSRVARRLQIANAEDDVLTIEKKLMAFFPKERWGRLHHQFIFFGRYKCKAIKPDCDGCPLKEYCNHLA